MLLEEKEGRDLWTMQNIPYKPQTPKALGIELGKRCCNNRDL
jgi:hypothetical protein